MSSDVDRVSRYFDLQLRKHARLLTIADLIKYKKKNKLSVSQSELNNIRARNVATAKHRRAKKKPQKFSSFHRPSLGILQVDLLFMPKRWRKFNNYCIGALVAVQPVTQVTFVRGIRSKTMAELEAAFDDMLYRGPFSKVTQIQSDMESALTSQKFSNRIMKIFGIKLVYLKAHVQAFQAENSIYTLKARTASVMKSRNEKFAWLEIMKEVVVNLNKQIIDGTKYRRIDVTPDNFMDFLAQKTGVKDATMLMNVGRLDVEKDSHLQKVFRFKIGDKVLVTRAADTTVSKKEKMFRKTSTAGYYSDQVFVIKETAMSLNVLSAKKVFVQVYRIAPIDSPKTLVKGIFYVEELTPALFTQSSSESD